MKYYLAIFTTILLFSTVEVASKLLHGDIDVIFLSFLRFFISGIVISVIGIKSIRKMEKRDLPMLCWYGVAGVTIALGAFHISLDYLEASKGAVIFSINPIFTAMFAVIFFKEKLGIRKIIGIILGFSGVWILNFGFDKVAFTDVKGPALMLIAAIFFAYYVVGSKKYVIKYGAFAATGVMFLAGAFVQLIFVRNFTINNLSSNIVPLLYISLVATGVAYLLYFYGLRYVSAAAGSSMFYLKPIIASILSVIILNETLELNFYIGLAVIILALTFTIFKPKPKEVGAEA